MLKSLILLSHFFFSASAFSNETEYGGWKEAYERGECKAASGDPFRAGMDVVLQCAPSPTVANLKVTAEAVNYSSATIDAQLSIENLNTYAVHIEFLTVDALDHFNNTVGFCSERVSLPVQPGEKVKAVLSCAPESLPLSDGTKQQSLTDIQGFKFVAAPQF